MKKLNVSSEKSEFNEIFEDKIVMITGGAGSFGQFVTRKILETKAREIRIFSRDEAKHLTIAREISDDRLRFIIGDVRDYDRLLEASKGVQILYHAAALKFIPECEKNPWEAVKTNLIGTENVKRSAIKNKIKKSLLISTDKAVKPVNLYGMTKAISEKIWISQEFECVSIFSVIRYGNVIGSTGSVIPYFKELIKQKKALPITHIEMTRFLITQQQAIELVFNATKNMKGGEIFVPIIPACLITELAKTMAGDEYPLEFIGIRPGEKIHESMVQEDEFRRTKQIGNYYVIFPYDSFNSGLTQNEFTSQNATQLGRNEIAELLKKSGWM